MTKIRNKAPASSPIAGIDIGLELRPKLRTILLLVVAASLVVIALIPRDVSVEWIAVVRLLAVIGFFFVMGILCAARFPIWIMKDETV